MRAPVEIFQLFEQVHYFNGPGCGDNSIKVGNVRDWDLEMKEGCSRRAASRDIRGENKGNMKF
jgi:hypothetical protein